MIRVNLLPIKQARRRSAGRNQLFVFAGLVLAEVLVLFLLFVIADAERSKAQDQVAQYERDVQQAKAEVKDAKELEQRKNQLEQQLNILAQLEKQRTGPVRVLDELQAVLSPPRSEEDKFAQLQRNWNVDWDSRRLWIGELKENEGRFELKGSAVNADDVAEFLQRLTTAEYFDKVELEIVQAKDADNLRIVDFSLNGKILYGGKAAVPKAKPAKKKKGS